MTNESPPTLFTRFAQLPRAAQLAIGGGLLVLVTLAYSDYAAPLIDDWNGSADDRLRILESSARPNPSTPEAERLQETIGALGPVSMPTHERKASDSVTNVINDILNNHQVSDWTARVNRPSRLPSTTLSRILDSGQRVERITGDLSFVADPDVAMAIIAELESHPEIESITKVDLRRVTGARKLDVHLVVEAWLLSRGRTGGA